MILCCPGLPLRVYQNGWQNSPQTWRADGGESAGDCEFAILCPPNPFNLTKLELGQKTKTLIEAGLQATNRKFLTLKLNCFELLLAFPITETSIQGKGEIYRKEREI